MKDSIEVWKDIWSYKEVYKISNLGNVKSLSRKLKTARGFRITKEKILKPRLDKDGYLLINLRDNNKTETHKIHRLVAQAFIPNPDNKPEVNHKKGDKLDNRDFMLEWNTAKENSFHKNNSLDKKDKRWKLNSFDVNIIRNHNKLNPNANKTIYQNIFRISRPHLLKILSNKSWINSEVN